MDICGLVGRVTFKVSNKVVRDALHPVTHKRKRKVHINSLKKYTTRPDWLESDEEEPEANKEIIYVGGEEEDGQGRSPDEDQVIDLTCR